MKSQVTQSQRFKANIKENKTVKSYVTCSLSEIFPYENSIYLGRYCLTVGAEGLERDILLGSTRSKWAKVDVFPAQASREKRLFRIYCNRMIE